MFSLEARWKSSRVRFLTGGGNTSALRFHLALNLCPGLPHMKGMTKEIFEELTRLLEKTARIPSGYSVQFVNDLSPNWRPACKFSASCKELCETGLMREDWEVLPIFNDLSRAISECAILKSTHSGPEYRWRVSDSRSGYIAFHPIWTGKELVPSVRILRENFDRFAASFPWIILLGETTPVTVVNGCRQEDVDAGTLVDKGFETRHWEKLDGRYFMKTISDMEWSLIGNTAK